MPTINLIHPSHLSDSHLVSEYYKLPRIYSIVKALADNGERPEDIKIPLKYSLEDDHKVFFYDKIGFLTVRYQKLFHEMSVRGIVLDFEIYQQKVANTRLIPMEWKRYYDPKPEDIYLNMVWLCKNSRMEHVLNEMDPT